MSSVWHTGIAGFSCIAGRVLLSLHSNKTMHTLPFTLWPSAIHIYCNNIHLNHIAICVLWCCWFNCKYNKYLRDAATRDSNITKHIFTIIYKRAKSKYTLDVNEPNVNIFHQMCTTFANPTMNKIPLIGGDI